MKIQGIERDREDREGPSDRERGPPPACRERGEGKEEQRGHGHCARPAEELGHDGEAVGRSLQLAGVLLEATKALALVGAHRCRVADHGQQPGEEQRHRHGERSERERVRHGVATHPEKPHDQEAGERHDQEEGVGRVDDRDHERRGRG